MDLKVASEYGEYVMFSDFVRDCQEVFQKRTWVPNWLWRLVAQRHMTADEISKELKQASHNLLMNLAAETECLGVNPNRYREYLIAKGWTLKDGQWSTPASWGEKE